MSGGDCDDSGTADVCGDGDGGSGGDNGVRSTSNLRSMDSESHDNTATRQVGAEHEYEEHWQGG